MESLVNEVFAQQKRKNALIYTSYVCVCVCVYIYIHIYICMYIPTYIRRCKRRGFKMYNTSGTHQEHIRNTVRCLQIDEGGEGVGQRCNLVVRYI